MVKMVKMHLYSHPLNLTQLVAKMNFHCLHMNHHQSNKYVKKYNDLPSVDFLIAQKNKIYLNKN